MKLKIQLFGITKEIIGDSEIDMQISDNQTVSELLVNLKKQYPGLEKLSSLWVAVNEDYAESDYILQNNDIVALIPPVSGG
jgi:molybdopterin synthase sulfur carrier subunit